MGLGLFFARSVVEHVGGRLEVRSEVGRGTEAALLLPVAP
jgi:two-component system sensor histidine kinase RegB